MTRQERGVWKLMKRFHNDPQLLVDRRKVGPEGFDPEVAGMISASRRVEVPSRHRRDSCPSHNEVDGFFSEFEAIRTELTEMLRAGDGEISLVEAVKALRSDEDFAELLGFDGATKVNNSNKDRLSYALSEMDADGALRLIVEDDGIGMSEEEIPIALAPFQQIDSDLSRRYQGTGLGLPLVKSLIELHDGRLEIDSAPEVGTSVALIFPPERTLGPGRTPASEAGA